VKLHLPPEQRFECTSCGRCCRAAWTIAVDAPAEPGIRDSLAFGIRAREGYLPLILVEGRLATARSADRSCTFLDDANLCELHRELGGEQKPLVCQTYPYLLTETPDGIYATLSYACPAALENVGPPLQDEQAGLERLIARRWPEMPQGTPVGQRVEVLSGSWLDWTDYLRLEVEILKAFNPAQPVESLLGAAIHLILAQSEEGDFALPQGGLALPYNFGEFDRQLATMVSCNLIAIAEEVTAPEERAQLGSLLWNGGRYVSNRFQQELPVFSLRRPSTELAQELIGRYVRNAVFGKRLLAGTVVSRLLGLVCGLAILLFYTEAFSQQDSDGLPGLDRAFTLVESELLSHTRSFDGFFVEFETSLCNVRDSLRGH
jgi:Fe-S-cluster containining protein